MIEKRYSGRVSFMHGLMRALALFTVGFSPFCCIYCVLNLASLLVSSYRNYTLTAIETIPCWTRKTLSVTQGSQKKAWLDWIGSHTPFSSHYGQRKGTSACTCLGGLLSPDHRDPWKHIGRGVFGKAERESKLKWQYRNPLLCASSFRAPSSCHLIVRD